MKFFGFVKMQTFLLECEICDNFLFLYIFIKEKKFLMISQFTYGLDLTEMLGANLLNLNETEV